MKIFNEEVDLKFFDQMNDMIDYTHSCAFDVTESDRLESMLADGEYPDFILRSDYDDNDNEVLITGEQGKKIIEKYGWDQNHLHNIIETIETPFHTMIDFSGDVYLYRIDSEQDREKICIAKRFGSLAGDELHCYNFGELCVLTYDDPESGDSKWIAYAYNDKFDGLLETLSIK